MTTIESDNTAIRTADIVDTIRTMRKQEDNYYHAHNYIHRIQPEVITNFKSLSDLPVDSDCRFRMTEWCYQIVDCCDLSRETAAIAISFLDRFLCVQNDISCDRRCFQLATMSALYTSIKINEGEAMDPQDMANLSRGAFTKEQIEAMEYRILSGLQWRVNPPTAVSFLELYLSLIPLELLDQESKDVALELARYPIEVAIGYADLIGVNASTIALAALLNSLDSLNLMNNSDDQYNLSDVQYGLSTICNIDGQCQHFTDVRIRLFEALGGIPMVEYSRRLTYPHDVFTTATNSSITINNKAMDEDDKEEDDDLLASPLMTPSKPTSPRSISVAM